MVETRDIEPDSEAVDWRAVAKLREEQRDRLIEVCEWALEESVYGAGSEDLIWALSDALGFAKSEGAAPATDPDTKALAPSDEEAAPEPSAAWQRVPPAWSACRDALQAHHEEAMIGSGRVWAWYEPAYRCGCQLAHSSIDEWAQILSEARATWEREDPGTWEVAMIAVEKGLAVCRRWREQAEGQDHGALMP